MAVTGADVVEWDLIAVREAVRVVDLARDEDWERETPCAGWDLRRLVAHMAAQHHGFAAAARGQGGRRRTGGSRTTCASRGGFIGWPRRQSWTPSVNPARRNGSSCCRSWAGVPGRTAISFHFVDYVVHAWDVAAALGVEVHLADDVLGAALAVARLVPTDPARRGPGFAFAPALEVPKGAGALEEALRLLGRAPEQWSGTAR